MCCRKWPFCVPKWPFCVPKWPLYLLHLVQPHREAAAVADTMQLQGLERTGEAWGLRSHGNCRLYEIETIYDWTIGSHYYWMVVAIIVQQVAIIEWWFPKVCFCWTMERQSLKHLGMTWNHEVGCLGTRFFCIQGKCKVLGQTQVATGSKDYVGQELPKEATVSFFVFSDSTMGCVIFFESYHIKPHLHLLPGHSWLFALRFWLRLGIRCSMVTCNSLGRVRWTSFTPHGWERDSSVCGSWWFPINPSCLLLTIYIYIYNVHNIYNNSNNKKKQKNDDNSNKTDNSNNDDSNNNDNDNDNNDNMYNIYIYIHITFTYVYICISVSRIPEPAVKQHRYWNMGQELPMCAPVTGRKPLCFRQLTVMLSYFVVWNHKKERREHRSRPCLTLGIFKYL